MLTYDLSKKTLDAIASFDNRRTKMRALNFIIKDLINLCDKFPAQILYRLFGEG
jgi:hypothetical protein